MILRDAGASAGLKRWQTTAGTALKFLETRVLKQKKQLFRPQRCQHARAYVAAVVMMGSILEALLLARSSLSPGEAYQAKSAPRDRVGKSVALHDWSLSTLVDVAVERGWIKSDRGNFSHAGH